MCFILNRGESHNLLCGHKHDLRYTGHTGSVTGNYSAPIRLCTTYDLDYHNSCFESIKFWRQKLLID